MLLRSSCKYTHKSSVEHKQHELYFLILFGLQADAPTCRHAQLQRDAAALELHDAQMNIQTMSSMRHAVAGQSHQCRLLGGTCCRCQLSEQCAA